MYLIIASFVLFLIMIVMLVLNKRLARFAYKDIAITNITSYGYCKSLYNKQPKNSGSLPVPIVNQFYIDNAFFIIKNKILKNKPLEKFEKIFFESREYIKRNYIKNTSKFDNVLYINDYCRVMLIAKAVLIEHNYKIKAEDIEEYLNRYNLYLIYNEINVLKDAIKYQIIVEISKVAKYIIYDNRMKNKAKNKLKHKYLQSNAYCYYYGKYTSNFESFNNELIKNNNNFDKVVSKYFSTKNYYIEKFYNLIFSMNNMDKLEPLNFYFGYKLLKNEFASENIKLDKINYVFSQISNLSNQCKESENIVILALIEYSKLMDKSVLILLEENNKKMIEYIKNYGSLGEDKKKV